MKKLITLLTIFFAVLSTTIYAQSQPYFNYQAVIRDNTGGLLINRLVNLKIAIREGNATGTISYQEVHTTTTNAFGLVNLVVGAGAPLQGSMPAVNWGDDTHFIDIELDANNTGVYTQMGATQILSVPYALNARTVEFNDDADADPTNEIQQFVLQNNVLYLDNGGNFVNLNPYLDNTDNQVISVFDSTTTIRNMLISGGNKVTFSVADIDNDSINELQTVFMLNDTLYLSRGGFIDLKPYLDNTDEQNLSLSNDTLVITGSNDTISLSDYRQNVSLANDTLIVTGSNDTISLLSYLDNTDEQSLTFSNDTLVITGSNDTISLSEFRQELSLSNDTLMLSGSNFVVLPPDSDGDSTNEIQSLSLTNDTLYLDLSRDTLDLTPYLDNTDEQTLSLTNDTLVISGSNDTISLVPYLDNTDNQNLTLLNDTLVITGSNDTISLSEFRQELSLSNDTLMLSGSNFIVLPPDSDGDSTNEIQSISLINDTLYLDLSGDTIDLTPYLDNTDEQTLTLINDTLVISGSNDTISLVSYLDNTDDQNLTLLNDTLVITGSNDTISLSEFRQELSLSNDTLRLSGSNFVVLPPDSDGDSTNEIQSLTLTNDTLYLDLSGDTLNLKPYLDNTDEQTLGLTNDTLVISGSNDTISLVPYLDNTDNQNLTLLNDTLVITGSNDTISLSEFRQELSLSNDTLVITGSNDTISLSDYRQNVTLANDTLIVTGSNDTISLLSYLDNTDEQSLTLSNDTLVITGSNDTINLVPYLDNTDDQAISISNDTIYLEDGGFVRLPAQIGISDLNRTGDSINVVGSPINISINDNDADSSNEIQTLSFSNDTLFLSLSEDTIDLSGYSLRIDTNSSEIASLYIELDEDSTNFDTLISNLSLTIVDSTMSAKTYAMMLSSADSNAVHSALVDTASDLRGTISSTRTALQADARSVSSSDSNVVHSALTDTASALRTLIGSAGDDLGDHTATQNIRLDGNYLSNDGGNEGLSIANNGRITINNAYTLPTVDGTANQVLQTDGSGVVFFGESPGVTNEHLRNKLDTVTEFIRFSCVLDANNNVYLPASGTDESTSINDIAVGELAPYSGEVISYSVFSDSNSGLVFGSFTVDATIDFLDNFNTTQNIRSNLGLITAGVSKKVTLGGVFADRSFSQGDMLHFRLIIPEAASNQVFHVIAEIRYFK